MENSNLKHNVLIENRNRIKINCVEDVESFNEEKAVVYTSMGTMIVSGYDFKVSKLSVEEGQLIIDGEIDRIEYTDDSSADTGSGGFLGRLFR